jgi:large subunit ribosomal protein L35
LRDASGLQESEMPKLKTKSSAKKRFKMTASGRVKSGMSGKRHGMIKRTPKQVRQKRRTDTLRDPDAKIVKKWMPYNR